MIFTRFLLPPLAIIAISLTFSFLVAQVVTSSESIGIEIKRLNDLSRYRIIYVSVSREKACGARMDEEPILILSQASTQFVRIHRIWAPVSIKEINSKAILILVNFTDFPDLMKPVLVRGTYPSQTDECIISEFLYGNLSRKGFRIGQKISIEIILPKEGALCGSNLTLSDFTRFVYECRVVGTYLPMEIEFSPLSSLMVSEGGFTSFLKKRNLKVGPMSVFAEYLFLTEEGASERVNRLRELGYDVHEESLSLLRRGADVYGEVSKRLRDLLLLFLAAGIFSSLLITALTYRAYERSLFLMVSLGSRWSLLSLTDLILYISSLVIGLSLGLILSLLSGPVVAQLTSGMEPFVVPLWIERNALSSWPYLILFLLINVLFKVLLLWRSGNEDLSSLHRIRIRAR